jgi:hypothetical protein
MSVMRAYSVAIVLRHEVRYLMPGARTTTAPAAAARAAKKPATKVTKATAPAARRPVSGPPAQLERRIDGIAVVRAEDVHSGLTSSSTKVKLRFEKLILADGSDRWACLDCDHVAHERGGAQKHRMDQHPHAKALRRQDRADEAARAAVMGLSLAEVMDLAVVAHTAAQTLVDLREANMAERKRAIAAETELARIRTALRRVGFRLEDSE